MATFLDSEDFERIVDEPDAVRRAGLACRLYADFEAGALDGKEVRAALSIFRAIARDRKVETRARFARFVAASRKLTRDLACHMAADVPHVAVPVIKRSPVLDDGSLVDLCASPQRWRQIAIARRSVISPPLAAALIEVACVEACQVLLANRGAALPSFGIERLIKRFPDHHGLRDLLLEQPDTPTTLVERHVSEVAERLSQFVAESGWLDQRTARVSASSAVDQALITYASRRPPEILAEVAARWAREGRLRDTFLVRVAMSGSIGVFEHSIAALGRIPLNRVRALVRDRGGYGFSSVCARMGLDRELEVDLQRVMEARMQIVGRNPHAPGKAALRAIAALVYDPQYLPAQPLSALAASVVRDIARTELDRQRKSGQPQRMPRAA